MLPTLLLAALPALSLPAQEAPLAQEAYIYDPQIQQYVLETGIAIIEAEAHTPNTQLQEQLASRRAIALPAPPEGRLTSKARGLYDKACAATVILASLDPVPGAEGEFTVGHAGTGFVVTEDGLVVTNYHVMRQPAATTYVAMLRDGRVLPVAEVVAGAMEHDLAVVRLAEPEGRPLPVLPIARDAEVGERVHVVGHPGHRFWRYSSGEIARFYATSVLSNGPVVGCLDVTAQFALGSSGGPVMNDSGQVVGIVSSMHPMFGEEVEGQPPTTQLVFRQCIPYETLLGLFAGAPTEDAPDAAEEPAAEAPPGDPIAEQ